jgi:hypothetical protein
LDQWEPINEEAWHWYNDHVGDKKCPVVDTGGKLKQVEYDRQLHL